MTTPTGQQYVITSGPYSATVTEVGATLRTFTRDGHDILRGFAVSEASAHGRGQQLLPWPNRIRDGIYTFNGVQQQLALSEPARNNAIHGLVRSVPWQVGAQTEDSITQHTTVYPQLGWDGILRAELTHRVGPDGLVVEVRATNIGNAAVPFGYAAHPYLTVGEHEVDDVAVRVPAGSFLEVDDRLLPVAIREVEDTVFDLRAGGPLGDTRLDTAFTDLERDSEGKWRVTLEREGRRAELWGDESMSWIQIYTGDDHRDYSLAIEPMTCGPDAFNDGPTAAGKIVLQPGEAYVGHWGIDGN